MKKSELIEKLNAIEGDPELLILCDRDIFNDNSDFDSHPAFISDIRLGIYATREIPDENCYEIFSSEQEKNRLGNEDIIDHGPRIVIELEQA